jgi:hypothetical protein
VSDPEHPQAVVTTAAATVAMMICPIAAPPAGSAVAACAGVAARTAAATAVKPANRLLRAVVMQFLQGVWLGARISATELYTISCST